MAKKIKLEFTEYQLGCILNIITTCEGMYGCAESENGEKNWDDVMNKDIQAFDRMLKSNGYERS